MNDFQNKFKPALNNTQRDVRILRAVIGGASFEQIGPTEGLSPSRARIVTRYLAFKLTREERRENPSLPLQFTFKTSEFVMDSAVWLKRIEKYLPIIEESFNNV